MADETDDDRAAVMTSAMLKAMSHPLRRGILKVLASRDFARAADIAAVLEAPANSVSFHLRVLADAGLIVEAPEKARDRRDRVWAAVPGVLNLGTPEHPVEDEALGGALLGALAQEHTEVLRRVIAWAPEYTAARTTEVHGTFLRSTLRLTEGEFESLMTAISQAIDDAREAHDPTAAGIRVWDLDIVAADDMI